MKAVENVGKRTAAGGSLHHVLLRYIPFAASLAAKAGVKLRKTPAKK
ncbi:MAG TPA: hypothetical protein VGI43_09290 [Mucilaginibacter sp.]|jgi:hypothetical protein